MPCIQVQVSLHYVNVFTYRLGLYHCIEVPLYSYGCCDFLLCHDVLVVIPIWQQAIYCLANMHHWQP